MTLAPHFAMSEVSRSATAAAKGIDNSVPLPLRYNIGRTAELMEHIRELLGGHPLKVTSWYRCEALNTAIGGSKSSAHMKGLAVDWKPTHLELRAAFSRVGTSAIPFDQLIVEGTKSGAGWIHIGLSEREPRREILSAFGEQLGGRMDFSRVRLAED